MKVCLNCGKKLTESQTKYCCRDCRSAFEQNEYISLWKTGKVDGRSGQTDISKYIRSYLLDLTDHRCQKCGWGEINPTTGRVPLHIHHIDGDYRNCVETNLQVLCPNCHSLTPNFGSLNKDGRGSHNSRKKYCLDCGKPISSVSSRCIECNAKTRITEKPVSREELKSLIRVEPFTKIGEKFGVSDNAIRKWCSSYNLPTKKKDIKAYSEEEWALI